MIIALTLRNFNRQAASTPTSENTTMTDTPENSTQPNSAAPPGNTGNNPFFVPVRPDMKPAASEQPALASRATPRQATASEYAQMNVTQRAEHDAKITDAMAGRDRIQVRDENGVTSFQDEKPLAGDAAREGTAAPGEKIKISDDLSVTPDEFRSVLERLGVEQSGKALAPTSPEGYQIALPENFQPPLGPDGKPLSVKFLETSPQMADAKNWAHRHGLSQAAFSEALQLYASDGLNEQAKFQTAFSAEKAKLGVTGGARVDAVLTWANATLGDDLGKTAANMLWTADSVKVFETIMQRMSSQGGGSFSNQHREPGQQGLSDEAYNKMTSAQKLDYARSSNMAQPARRRG
jgi:hypothetical protein